METSFNSSPSSSNAASSFTPPSSPEPENSCNRYHNHEECSLKGCPKRLERIMNLFHKLLPEMITSGLMTLPFLKAVEDALMHDFPQKTRQIKHFSGVVEVEFKIQNTQKGLDKEIALRDAAASNTNANLSGALMTFGAIELPLGNDVKHWAVNEAERKHWNWLVEQVIKKAPSSELGKKLRVIRDVRKELDARGIPTYVCTKYSKNQDRSWVVQDVQLLDCRNLLNMRTFNPARIDVPTCHVIQAWLLRAAANDTWRQRLTYKWRIAPPATAINESNAPKLGSFTAVGEVKTTATMSVLRQTANEQHPEESDYDSEYLVESEPEDEDEDDIDDEDDDMDESSDECQDEPQDESQDNPEEKTEEQKQEELRIRKKYGGKHVATPEHIIKLRSRGRQLGAAKKLNQRERRRAKEYARAEREKYEARWGDYFARINASIRQSKPPSEYKNVLSRPKLRELQATAPEGGNWKLGSGKWVKFPGVDDLDDEEYDAIYGAGAQIY